MYARYVLDKIEHADSAKLFSGCLRTTYPHCRWYGAVDEQSYLTCANQQWTQPFFPFHCMIPLDAIQEEVFQRIIYHHLSLPHKQSKRKPSDHHDISANMT